MDGVNSVSHAEGVDSLLQKYHNVFQGGLRTLKGVQAKLHVKPNAVSKFFRPRPVPSALQAIR